MQTLRQFLAKENQLIWNSVIVIWIKKEDTLLPEMSRYLVEWAGNRTWEEGYFPESARLAAEEIDYGRKLAMSLSIGETPKNTVRQFCYQFVKLANKIKEKLLSTEQVIADFKATRRYKIFRFLHLIPSLK